MVTARAMRSSDVEKLNDNTVRLMFSQNRSCRLPIQNVPHSHTDVLVSE